MQHDKILILLKNLDPYTAYKTYNYQYVKNFRNLGLTEFHHAQKTCNYFPQLDKQIVHSKLQLHKRRSAPIQERFMKP